MNKLPYDVLMKFRQMYVQVCSKRGLDVLAADAYFTKRARELGWME